MSMLCMTGDGWAWVEMADLATVGCRGQLADPAQMRRILASIIEISFLRLILAMVSPYRSSFARQARRVWVPVMLLAFCLLALPQQATAGDKLRKLKDDVQHIQNSTLLIAPVMPDSFVLRKYAGPKHESQRTAYLEAIRLSNENLQMAMQKHYRFSKVQVLPAYPDYASYFAALKAFDPEHYCVLQFAVAPSRKASNYDKEFLGIYALDGHTRLYLNQGKVLIFPKLAYAEAIVKNLQINLDRYARADGKRGKHGAPKLLAPALTGKVALLPQERLYGNESLTFRNGQYQTVVTTLPLKLYRAFGGAAMPGGSFVTPDSIRDTSATRRDLAILIAWGNTLEFEAVINVPVATKLNVGIAASQADLQGGGEQVIMPFQWNVAWIDRIYHTRSAQSWTLAAFRAAYPQYFPTR
jgi:hypothetical protein